MLHVLHTMSLIQCKCGGSDTTFVTNGDRRRRCRMEWSEWRLRRCREHKAEVNRHTHKMGEKKEITTGTETSPLTLLMVVVVGSLFLVAVFFLFFC